jgi:hypothetical protein
MYFEYKIQFLKHKIKIKKYVYIYFLLFKK